MRLRPILGLCAIIGSCAKPELPPGTPPDRSPPRSVETRPAYGESVPGFDGDAWIRFDEPISNPRSFDRTLLASPAGRYRVTPGRSRIKFRPEDGWQDGVVYYFALPAGISDLVNNRTDAPTELLFSTGAEVSPTLVQGRAYDRVSGRGTRGVRLLFLSADSVPYTAVSDTGGVYRLPGLPYGGYSAMAFVDQDRDFEYDEEFEPGAVETFEVSAEAATATVDVWMLPADTTPPILASAELVDSVTIRLNFDDPLDPEASLADARVVVRLEPEGPDRSQVDVVVGRPPPPEAPPDTLAADAEAAPPIPAPSGRPPAATFATVTFSDPFMAGTYSVEASGFTNLRGLPGGGEATLEVAPEPEPEEPDPEPAP